MMERLVTSASVLRSGYARKLASQKIIARNINVLSAQLNSSPLLSEVRVQGVVEKPNSIAASK